MGSKQHFLLFETVSGFSLVLVKEFDDITRRFSAHPNSFLKPVAFVPFISITDALDNVQAIANGEVSPLLSTFLRQNLPNTDVVLGVADEILGKSILKLDLGIECIWDASVREILRIVRSNSSRLLRSLLVQPGEAPIRSTPHPIKSTPCTTTQEIIPGMKAEKRARLIISLSRARLQLDLLHHLADSGVVRSLSLLDSMDENINKSVKCLKSAYALHFPELCRSTEFQIPDFTFISLIANFASREELLSCRTTSPSSVQLLTEWSGDQKLTEKILSYASSSTGQDLALDDLEILQKYANFLLRLLKSRTKCCEMLERRVRSLVPNLTALMDHALPISDSSSQNVDKLERVSRLGDKISSVFVVARLLSHAVTLDRLAKMSSSRINSLGASKSLFRKSGAISATAAGLLGTVAKNGLVDNLLTSSSTSVHSMAPTATASVLEMSGGRLKPIVVRRRMTRILAAKASLACRADCYRHVNPFQTNTNNPVSCDPRLANGEYGADLGEEAKRQLRVWAESNAVQIGRSAEQLQKQKDHRKQYRKQKRKNWLRRKLAGTNSSHLPVEIEKTSPTEYLETPAREYKVKRNFTELQSTKTKFVKKMHNDSSPSTAKKHKLRVSPRISSTVA